MILIAPSVFLVSIIVPFVTFGRVVFKVGPLKKTLPFCRFGFPRFWLSRANPFFMGRGLSGTQAIALGKLKCCLSIPSPRMALGEGISSPEISVCGNPLSVL